MDSEPMTRQVPPDSLRVAPETSVPVRPRPRAPKRGTATVVESSELRVGQNGATASPGYPRRPSHLPDDMGTAEHVAGMQATGNVLSLPSGQSFAVGEHDRSSIGSQASLRRCDPKSMIPWPLRAHAWLRRRTEHGLLEARHDLVTRLLVGQLLVTRAVTDGDLRMTDRRHVDQEAWRIRDDE